MAVQNERGAYACSSEALHEADEPQAGQAEEPRQAPSVARAEVEEHTQAAGIVVDAEQQEEGWAQSAEEALKRLDDLGPEKKLAQAVREERCA